MDEPSHKRRRSNDSKRSPAFPLSWFEQTSAMTLAVAWGEPSSHSITESKVTLDYDLSLRDPSFESSVQSYTIHYSFHLPEVINPALPVLLLCHPFNNSRAYWAPQISSPKLAAYPKIAFDSIGFGRSKTGGGRPWSFDLAAASVLAALEQERVLDGLKAIVMGDSMGGGPVGLRIGLADGGKRIRGIVCCASAAEEESAETTVGYQQIAQAFADSCLTAQSAEEIEQVISDHANAIAGLGYGDSSSPRSTKCREFGTQVIKQSLLETLSVDTESGSVLDPRVAGETMKTNFRCLYNRQSLISELQHRPSKLGACQVIVIHGTNDLAYPHSAGYPDRTLAAVGNANAELVIIEDAPHFLTVNFAEFEGVTDADLVAIIGKNWDLRPGVVVKELGLQQPKGWSYEQTASYGHFGNPAYPWEQPKQLTL